MYFCFEGLFKGQQFSSYMVSKVFGTEWYWLSICRTVLVGTLGHCKIHQQGEKEWSTHSAI